MLLMSFWASAIAPANQLLLPTGRQRRARSLDFSSGPRQSTTLNLAKPETCTGIQMSIQSACAIRVGS